MGQAQDRIEELGRAIADQQDALIRELPLDDGRAAFIHRAVARTSGIHRKPLAMSRPLILAAAAIIPFLLIVALRSRSSAPLTFHVGQIQDAPTGTWVDAPAKEPIALRFSDGSIVLISPRGKAQVASVSKNGARIVVQRGVANVAVQHRSDTSWRVEAGPFSVAVTGTKFQVAWDPAGEVFVLSLGEGSVNVSGPIVGNGRAVRTGEALRIECRAKKLEVGDSATLPMPAALIDPAAAEPSEPKTEAATPPSPEPTASAASEPANPSGTGPNPVRAQAALTPAPNEPAPEPMASATPSAAAADAPTWSELARKGLHKEALVAAESTGFAQTIETAGASDLTLLANAARFSGNTGRSTQALLALRKRFEGSDPSATAAFLLGKLAFDGYGNTAEAMRWFEAYLSERPSGSLAMEALGRLLECRVRLGDRAAAERIAKDYVQRYPKGPHAEKARSLLAN